MMKHYVLDTNVLLHDPMSVDRLSGNHIYIPLPVLEEMDTFKKGSNDRGAASRMFNRRIDELRLLGKEQGTTLNKGVNLEDGGSIKVMTNHPDFSSLHLSLDDEKVDNIILNMIGAYQQENGVEMILITKDCNMRVKADALGINSEDYKHGRVKDIDRYDQKNIVKVTSEFLSMAYHMNFSEKYPLYHPNNIFPKSDYSFMVCEDDETEAKIPVYVDSNGAVEIIDKKNYSDVFKISPKNADQLMALHALMNPDISCIALAGKAGTGKTLIALAAGLEQTLNSRLYNRVLLSRPVMPMTREMGYLPGSLREKLDPWLAPIYDSFDFLFSKADNSMRGRKGIQNLEDMGMIEVQALSHVRGRNIPKVFWIIDEAQNLTPHAVKTIVTRAGEGAKIVFTGDPYQIDSPYLDSHSNGLSYLIDRMNSQEVFAGITLHKGERSELAELAARVL